MSEKYVHRTCPCYKWDVEGIQTWLEDMAAKGLHLEPDGGLFGIFSFLKGEPKQVRYRLTPVKESGAFLPTLMFPTRRSRNSPKTAAGNMCCGTALFTSTGPRTLRQDPCTRIPGFTPLP